MSTTTEYTTEGSAGHGHAHGADRSKLGRAFAVGVALNVTFVVVEAIYGIAAHSTALLADSAHNASDVLGLGLAWIAASLARRKPSLRHTYGLRASTVLAALTNAVLLLVAVGGVSWEAIRRLVDPDTHHVEGLTVLAVAAVGVVINAASALLFLRGRTYDANVRAAFLHLAADAGVSLGVVVAGAVIMKTGWDWLDPAVSLAVSIVVLLSTWDLLREALHLALALAGVPSGGERRRSSGLPAAPAGRVRGARPAYLAHGHDRGRPHGASRGAMDCAAPVVPAGPRARAEEAVRNRPRHRTSGTTGRRGVLWARVERGGVSDAS